MAPFIVGAIIVAVLAVGGFLWHRSANRGAGSQEHTSAQPSRGPSGVSGGALEGEVEIETAGKTLLPIRNAEVFLLPANAAKREIGLLRKAISDHRGVQETVNFQKSRDIPFTLESLKIQREVRAQLSVAIAALKAKATANASTTRTDKRGCFSFAQAAKGQYLVFMTDKYLSQSLVWLVPVEAPSGKVSLDNTNLYAYE